MAGHFIHHEPTDVPGMDHSGGTSPSKTVKAMQGYGPVDVMLWTTAPDCNSSGCHSSNCNQSRSSGGH
jgi:hypothetical protein